MIKIIAVGDIMPGGVLNGTNRQFITDDVKQILDSGDIRVGTLETAIGNEPTFYDEKMKRKADVIYAEDDDLKRLVELNINIVSLANNHFFDLGPQGAEHTIDLLDQLGIKYCGGGRNIEEASKPVVETINGKTIAFLAFCDWREETTGWCPFATENAPGVNPMYDDYVVSEIRKYRSLYDYIVVIPHWGKEYQTSPTKEVYKMAKLMIKSGADLVLGGHTHSVQPIWTYRKSVVVFSLGNFFFPDRLIIKPRSTYYSPEPIDYSVLPSTEGYPYVETITYKKWKDMARYGQIVVATIENNSIGADKFYTHLQKNNVIELVEDFYYLKRVRFSTYILILGLFPCYDFIKNAFVLIKKAIYKALHYAKHIS